MVFGSHQLEQKKIGLRSKISSTLKLQWGRWVPIETFLKTVTDQAPDTKHWLSMSFGKLGEIFLELLQKMIAAGSYAVIQFDSALSRVPAATIQEML